MADGQIAVRAGDAIWRQRGRRALSLTKAHGSNAGVLAVTILCLTSIIIQLIKQPTVIERAPVRPAMVVHSLEISNPMIAVGQPLHVHFTYDWRKDCPAGKYRFSAEVRNKGKKTGDSFMLPWGKTAGASDELPGINMAASIDVLTAMLPAGSYSLSLVARFSCKGETTDQIISPDNLSADFDVVEPELANPWQQ